MFRYLCGLCFLLSLPCQSKHLQLANQVKTLSVDQHKVFTNDHLGPAFVLAKPRPKNATTFRPTGKVDSTIDKVIVKKPQTTSVPLNGTIVSEKAQPTADQSPVPEPPVSTTRFWNSYTTALFIIAFLALLLFYWVRASVQQIESRIDREQLLEAQREEATSRWVVTKL